MTAAAEIPVRNERIRRRAELRVLYLAQHPAEIDARLEEIDREWDIDRMLAANASAFVFLGLGMGLRNRAWLLLPAAVGAFLLQHALQGRCPPASLLRRLGVRTQAEIAAERYALRVLRGDFPVDGTTPEEDRLVHALLAVRR